MEDRNPLPGKAQDLETAGQHSLKNEPVSHLVKDQIYGLEEVIRDYAKIQPRTLDEALVK